MQKTGTSGTQEKPKKRTFVPRAVLTYAGIGLGMGVIPLCESCFAFDTGPGVGVEPCVDCSPPLQLDAAPDTPSIGVDIGTGMPDASSDAADALSDASADLDVRSGQTDSPPDRAIEASGIDP